jgi:formate hydrogenlyase transcriptional activator
MTKFAIARRYETIAAVNAAAIASTNPQQVFGGLCSAIRGLVPYNRAALALYDREADVLKIVARDGPFHDSFFGIGAVLGRKDSHQGWTFENKKPIIKRDVEREREFPIEQYTVSEGLRSYCAVPLIVRGESIGVVTLLSFRKNHYSRSHADLLQELSKHIVLAVDSLMPYCCTHTSTKLICPRCIASAGGKVTTSRYKSQLSDWGKQGGRGKRKPA